MRQKERWATRVGLVLAMAGNAVGLGNFLRFPAQAAANGGGAFLIPYIVALLLMGLPLIWVEWAMGRFGGQFGHHSTPGIFQAHDRGRLWKYCGVLGLWSCLVIASYYLYIESWCMAYAGYSAINGFAGTDPKEFFASLTGQKPNSVIAVSAWGLGIFALCITINIYILSRGLARGIELVAKVGMPLLIFFAALLAVRGLMIGPDDPGVYHDPVTGAAATPWEGLNFVWQPKFDRLGDPATWLAAAGQIFFTLSIGMGSIHCYASYLREKDDIALTGTAAASTNEFCEVILGGTILIPIAVAYLGLTNTQAQSGFGLGFMVFPTLFNNWGALAPVAGFLWFGLLFFAAITSSLAMGQPIMAFLQAEFGFTRKGSALALGGMVLSLAIPVAIFTSSSFFDEFDYWAGTFGLVIFALLEIILFVGFFGMTRGWAEINKGAELRIPRVFYFIIKYITPVFLIVILVAYVFKPAPDWGPYLQKVFRGEQAAWEWAPDGFIGKLMHNDLPIDPNDPPEKRSFIERLKVLRNVDRLVLLGVFFGFSTLVLIAWRRRRAQGLGDLGHFQAGLATAPPPEDGGERLE